MSEAQDFHLSYPCDYCHSDVGEPCPPDCPGMATEDALYSVEVIGTPPSGEARLAAAVHRLPFGGLVGIRGTGAPDRQDYPLGEWIELLADWMTEYEQVLRCEVDQLQVQARQRIGLQIEKDCARAWIGASA